MTLHRNAGSLLVLALLAAATFPVTARCDLWKTEAQLIEKYGDSVDIRRSLDERTFTFQRDDIRIEVQIVDGVSQEVTYRHEPRRKSLSAETIESLLLENFESNLWHRTGDRKWELEAPAIAAASLDDWLERLAVATVAFDQQRTAKILSELYSPAPTESRTGAEKQFRGVLEFKDEENESRVAIVRDGDTVLEIPWAWKDYAGKAKLEPGKTYEITVRDEDHLDTAASTVFISDRVHKSHNARVDDSETFPLVRIKDADTVVFDEAVCELHHVRMDRTTANIEYGLPALGGCDTNFPHHAGSIRGGCIERDAKTAPHYVCPKCVAACAKYQHEHPGEARRTLWQRVKSAFAQRAAR